MCLVVSGVFYHINPVFKSVTVPSLLSLKDCYNKLNCASYPFFLSYFFPLMNNYDTFFLVYNYFFNYHNNLNFLKDIASFKYHHNNLFNLYQLQGMLMS